MRLTLFFLACLTFHFLHAQSTAEEWIQDGIEKHDAGDYSGAILSYLESIKYDPNSPLPHYEIAMSALANGDHKLVDKHAKTALKLDTGKELAIHTYTLWGNSYSERGKFKKALDTYDRAEAAGVEHFLLPYNRATVHMRMENVDAAYADYRNALALNPTHPGSHYGVGMVEKMRGNRIESLLALYYYLLLEPTHAQRSPLAFDFLQDQLNGRVGKEESGNISINLLTSDLERTGPFKTLPMLLDLKMATTLPLADSLGLSPVEMFPVRTGMFIDLLPEPETVEEANFSTDFYVPFFQKLHAAEHTEAFSYYVLHGLVEEAETWLGEHPEEFQTLVDWLGDE